jgi:7-carboxy-7-deazaguanine synthase
MTKLRVSEVYLSVQGEGPRVGATTVFIRFAGCNLRCPGWPCDTPHAIFPELIKLDAEALEPEEVLQRVRDLVPSGANICFTGGEPFLQHNETLHTLSDLLTSYGYTTQEVFTNGTFKYPDWAIANLCLVVDWKLAGSGEVSRAWPPKMRLARSVNMLQLRRSATIKFTIASREDYEEALEEWAAIKICNDNPSVYYGVVWGTVEPSTLIEWVLSDSEKTKHWKYNHQIHNVIWDRNKRGI